MYFNVEFDHYGIEWSDSETGPAWSRFATFVIANGTGDDAGWLQFSHTAMFSPANWYRVTPFDSSDTPGQSSPAIQIGGSTGNPPGITDVSPRSGEVGANVQFTVDYTGDLPMTFEWYFGGGATPNTSTDESPAVMLGAPNEYSCSVTLTNASGSDTYDFFLNVTPTAAEWQYYTVVDSMDVGDFSSFAFVDGMPAFAYTNTGDGTLHYVRATVAVPASSSDWVDMSVDDSGTRWYDGNVSLAVDNYLTPIILAWDSGSGEAVFAGSNVITPDSAADWETSAITISVEETGALALAEGVVLATYKSLSGLYVAEATTYPPAGPADWSEVQIDSSIGAGAYSLMKYNVEEGRLYIESYNTNTTELYLSHCLFDDRASPGMWVTFPISGLMGLDEGMYFDFAFDPTALSDNFFTIFWRDWAGTSGILGIIGYEGEPDNSNYILDGIVYESGTQQGQCCSLALEEGLVAMSYNRTTPADLMFATSPYVKDISPVGWVLELVPDPSASLITDTSVLIYNHERAMIIYNREDGVYFATAMLE